jgi:catechol 2,3-dioxygenase-like lactoylglutathione lyase family enzyme
MPNDDAGQSWAIRSTLIAVADLERSVAFYQELGPFEEVAREDAVVVLGDLQPPSVVLMLRETRGVHHARHGQQSVGLRSITFNVGSIGELGRVESVLQSHNLFTSRATIADGASEILRGRDPDQLPLVFVCYATDALLPDYYRTIANLTYTLDT